MLKQELLGHLHSKAKWFAINQVKTVLFNVDPALDKSEDLNKDVDRLKNQPNFEEYKKPNSAVLGEKFGKKFPVVTIRDLKVEQFWPFVASSSWDDCSSLRVSDGIMLHQLTRTYEKLLRENKIYKFSTRVYDHVILEATKQSCLKDKNNEKSVVDPVKSKPEHMRTEVTSICFTYYGTSVQHLLDLLHSEGHVDVTVLDIINQNKDTSDKSQVNNDLQLLCRGKPTPKKPLRIEYEEADSGTPHKSYLEDKFGRQRLLYHRRISTQYCDWPDFEQEDEQKEKLQTRFFNEHQLEELKENHETNESSIRKRLAFFKYLRQRYGTSKDAYEYWWYNFIAQVDDLRNSFKKSPQLGTLERRSGSPNSQKKQQKIPAKPPLPSKATIAVVNLPDGNGNKKRNSFDGAGFFAKGAKDKTNMDHWTCLCDVCTGGFLAHDSKLNFYMNVKSDHKINDHDELDFQHPRRKSTSPKSPPGRKHGKLSRKSKNKGDTAKSLDGKKQSSKDDVFWESVSNYTTPYWIGGAKENDEHYREFRDGKISSEFHGRHLNVRYSYDHLRLKTDFEQLKLSYSIDQLHQGKRKPSLSEREKKLLESLDERRQKFCPLDYATLKELGILYSYQPDIRKQYKQLKVVRKPSPKSSHNAATSMMVSYDTGKTSWKSKRRGTFPPIQKSTVIQRKRFGSFPQSPDDNLAAFKHMVPTVTPEQKVQAFFNTSIKEDDYRVTIQQPQQEQTIEEMMNNLVLTPPDFDALCLAALRVFVIRSETIMISGDYHNIKSLTINRHPMCTFPTSFEADTSTSSSDPINLSEPSNKMALEPLTKYKAKPYNPVHI